MSAELRRFSQNSSRSSDCGMIPLIPTMALAFTYGSLWVAISFMAWSTAAL